MAVRTKTARKSRGYVREWMEQARLRQADLVKKLDWSKAKANAIWHGEQRLNEDVLEAIAPLVHAETYELLISPATAMQLRRLSAALDAAVKPVEDAPVAPSETTRRKVS